MKTFDIDEVKILLQIHSEVMKHPVLRNIRDETMNRLRQIDDDMAKQDAPLTAGPRVIKSDVMKEGAAEDPNLVDPINPAQNLPDADEPLLPARRI